MDRQGSTINCLWLDRGSVNSKKKWIQQLICVLKTMNLIKIFLLGDSSHTFCRHRNFKLRPCKASHDYLPIKVAHVRLANICQLWRLPDNYAWNICWHLLLQKYVQWVSGGWVGSTHQQFHCGTGSKLGPNTQTQLAQLSILNTLCFWLIILKDMCLHILTLRCTIFLDLWEPKQNSPRRREESEAMNRPLPLTSWCARLCGLETTWRTCHH